MSCMSKPMFIPTSRGTLFRGVTLNGRGKETYTDEVPIRYTSIRLKTSIDETSIRTDKSASQGRAEEESYDGRILVATGIEPVAGQAVRLNNSRVYKIAVVLDVCESTGTLDHYQLDLVL